MRGMVNILGGVANNLHVHVNWLSTSLPRILDTPLGPSILSNLCSCHVWGLLLTGMIINV